MLLLKIIRYSFLAMNSVRKILLGSYFGYQINTDIFLDDARAI